MKRVRVKVHVLIGTHPKENTISERIRDAIERSEILAARISFRRIMHNKISKSSHANYSTCREEIFVGAPDRICLMRIFPMYELSAAIIVGPATVRSEHALPVVINSTAFRTGVELRKWADVLSWQLPHWLIVLARSRWFQSSKCSDFQCATLLAGGLGVRDRGWTPNPRAKNKTPHEDWRGLDPNNYM